MKILVCLKQVPDTSEVELDPETNTLIRKGLPSIINPDDVIGIEMALAIKKEGDTVTAVSMGPQQADIALLEALAMGCDDAVLISGREFGGSDTLATSTILSAAIGKLGYDLVICGRQAIDGDTAQVGPQIAEHLGIPQVTYAESIERDGDSLIIMRQFETFYHKVKVKMPCLVTVIAGNTDPRYMTVDGIIEASGKEIRVLDYESLKDVLPKDRIGLRGSPTNVVKSYAKETKPHGAVLKGLSSAQAVDAIMAGLVEGHII